MADIEKVIKGLSCLARAEKPMANPCAKCDYKDRTNFAFCVVDVAKDALELLKEHEAMNVDSFVQWCIDSHIVGDATIRGIKYWVDKYKEIKEER